MQYTDAADVQPLQMEPLDNQVNGRTPVPILRRRAAFCRLLAPSHARLSPDKVSTRWSPMTEAQRVFGGMFSAFGRVSEVEVWKRARALDKAEKWLARIKRNEGARHERLHLETRSTNLSKLGLDSRAMVRVFSWYDDSKKE